MSTKIFVFLLTIILGSHTSTVTCFSRNDLQEKYPGYGIDWIPMGQYENGSLIVGYFNKTSVESRGKILPDVEESVHFTLFTRGSPEGVEIQFTDELDKTFDKNKPTKFVTHGWLSDGNSDTCVKIKDGFLEKYDANVFIVDWSKIAGNVIYPIPMLYTEPVGQRFSEFVSELVNLGVDPKDIHIVGHSLGAHVSGFAARAVKNGKIGRITGLDPALPGFGKQLIEGQSLNRNDAEFVDIIHTCGGLLGFQEPLGHADFYPNGGTVPQPGCFRVELLVESCSHGRSWHYFAESLTGSVPFESYKCDSYESFLEDKNCEKGTVPMGDPAPVTARGNYYLVTDSKEPFAVARKSRK